MEDLQNLVNQLGSIPTDDPRAIRRRALELVEDVVPCDFATFFKLTWCNGEPYRTGFVSIGDEDLQGLVDNLEGEPYSDFEHLWDPRRPQPEAINSFKPMHYEPERLLTESESTLLRRFYGCYHVPHQVRALVYEGRTFLGWFGLMRRRDRAFETDGAVEVLEQIKASLASALSAAERMERSELEAPADLIVEPEGLSIEYASEHARNWLTPRRLETIRDLARRTESSGHLPVSSLVVDGCRVRFARMKGDRNLRYLVTIEPPAPPTLEPELLLTSRQLEVAEYAAVGGRTSEIAKTLEISPETVRYHLNNIYDRLDIESRAELARVIDVYQE